MQESIRIREHPVLVQAVCGRELWKELNSKQEFSNWIKGRISKYGFLQGIDFLVDKNINSAFSPIDYYISLDMAKELSMVENNEEGRRARKYFIEAEKQLRQVSTPQNYIQALQALIVSETTKEAALLEVDRLETKIALDAPNTQLGNIVSEGRGTVCVRVWVKTLKHEFHFIIGAREVFKWLLENKYVFRDTMGYLPYAKYEPGNKNYFAVKLEEHGGKPRRVLKITNRGVAALTPIILSAFEPEIY
jgi:anti-repressor protein